MGARTIASGLDYSLKVRSPGPTVQNDDLLVVFVMGRYASIRGLVPTASGWTSSALRVTTTHDDAPMLGVYTRRLTTADRYKTWYWGAAGSQKDCLTGYLLIRDAGNVTHVQTHSTYALTLGTTLYSRTKEVTVYQPGLRLNAFGGRANVANYVITPPSGGKSWLAVNGHAFGSRVALTLHDRPIPYAGVSPEDKGSWGSINQWWDVNCVVIVGDKAAPPFAPTLLEPASKVNFTEPVKFHWAHEDVNDPNREARRGESWNPDQQRYALRRKNGTTTQWWNRSTGSWSSAEVRNLSSDSVLTFSPGTWSNGIAYEWAVSTTDQTGLHSPYKTATVTGDSGPAVAITSPPASVTDTTRPEVVWTMTDADGDPQTAWKVAWYTPTLAPVAEQVGFGSSTRSWLLPEALTPGSTYRLYVWAQSKGVWSSPATRTVTIDVDPPSQPSVLLDVQPTRAAVDVRVGAADTDGTPYGVGPYGAGPYGGGDPDALPKHAEVQRSDDGGVTWTYLSEVLTFPGGDTSTVLSDYAAPEGQEVLYRARIVAELVGGGEVTGAWSIPFAATLNVSGWFLTPLLMPEQGRPVWVSGDPAWSFDTGGRARTILGARHPAVVSGTARARRGTLQLYTRTAAEREALYAILKPGVPLKLRRPPEDVTDRGQSWTLEVVNDLRETRPLVGRFPYRTITADVVEVG